MSEKIGIIGDIHSAVDPLRQALEIFRQHGVSSVICTGDIAGYGEDSLEEVVGLLKQHECICVIGNHDDVSDPENTANFGAGIQDFFRQLPIAISLEIEGKRIFVVHANPPDKLHGGIKLLDQDGYVIPTQISQWKETLANFNHDILIVGHTHQVFAETISDTLVINPGSSLFNHSCMILTLPEMTTEVYKLGSEEIIKSWNWGLFYQQDKKKS